MRIALLGAAHWHAPCYHRPAAEMGHEVILFDDDGERMREVCDRFGYAFHTDVADLDEVRPDFAVCLGRHDVMPEYTSLCIDRGIPLLAEKPGGLTADAVRGLARRCDEKQLFNAGPFSMRWDGACREIRDRLERGEFGRVARISLSYFAGAARRYIGWKCSWVLKRKTSGGGSLYNVGVHMLDLLRFWGFEPEYVAGCASWNINRGDVDDVASLMLRCGEAYAIVESGYLVQNPFGGARMVLFCEKANVEYSRKRLTITRPDGSKETLENTSPEPRGDMLRDLLDLCRQGKTAPDTLHDMAAVMEICDAFAKDCYPQQG